MGDTYTSANENRFTGDARCKKTNKESFLTLHWQQRNLHIQDPEQYKDIIKVINVTPVV